MATDRYNLVRSLQEIASMAAAIAHEYHDGLAAAVEVLEDDHATETDRQAAVEWATTTADPLREYVAAMLRLLDATKPADNHTPPPADASPALKQYIRQYISLKAIPLSGHDDNALALWLFHNGYQS